jgi:3-hydroxyisobutyrate dehydrogenase-like beta-hydroxyacid dehydrogenase
MGCALASALLGTGHSVVVWNRTPARYAGLLERGAQAAGSPAEAISTADLVVVCLLDHPTTREVLASGGVTEALAGRTLLQLSFSDAEEATELQRWVLERRADYLHGQIKAYPREIATPAARVNYSGPRATYERFRETLEAFGKSVYLGADVAAASVVSNIAASFYQCIIVAFLEAAAYARAEGAELENFIARVPTAMRLATDTIEYSARQMAADAFEGDQASIDAHANSLATMVNAMGRGRRQPRLTRAALDYMEEAQSDGLGSLEIAALYGMLLDSFEPTPTPPDPATG